MEETFTYDLYSAETLDDFNNLLMSALEKVWKGGGEYSDDHLRITVSVKYVPENK